MNYLLLTQMWFLFLISDNGKKKKYYYCLICMPESRKVSLHTFLITQSHLRYRDLFLSSLPACRCYHRTKQGWERYKEVLNSVFITHIAALPSLLLKALSKRFFHCLKIAVIGKKVH